MQTKMLIGNMFEAGNELEETILNPRTGEMILKMPEADMGQIDRAVAAARHAFTAWSRTTPADRAGLLLQIADAVETNGDELAALEALNCGKPIALARGDEIPAVADCFRYFAGAVRNMHGPLAGEYLEGHTSMIRRDAIGVIASIAPCVSNGAIARAILAEFMISWMAILTTHGNPPPPKPGSKPTAPQPASTYA